LLPTTEARVKSDKIYQVSIHFRGGGMSLRYVQADSEDAAISKIKSALADFDSGPVADAMRRGIESARAQVVS
jgi:hypothetical protein